jgi:hypothetical protein
MAELVKMIVRGAYNKGSLGWNNSEAKDRLTEKMEKFFSTFETGLTTIKKNQKFFKRFLNDKKLVDFLIKQ